MFVFLPKTGGFCCFLPAEPLELPGQNWRKALSGALRSTSECDPSFTPPKVWKSCHFGYKQHPRHWWWQTPVACRFGWALGCLHPTWAACACQNRWVDVCNACVRPARPSPCFFVAFFNQKQLFFSPFPFLLRNRGTGWGGHSFFAAKSHRVQCPCFGGALRAGAVPGGDPRAGGELGSVVEPPPSIPGWNCRWALAVQGHPGWPLPFWATLVLPVQIIPVFVCLEQPLA